MLVVVPTPRQLACQLGSNIKCDLGSMVAGATRLITGASDTALDGGVRFLGEFSIMAGAFASGQALNFGSLAYIIDCYGELRPLHGATLAGNVALVLPLLPGLLGVDLEVLA